MTTYRVETDKLSGFTQGQSVKSEDIPSNFAAVDLLVKAGILTKCKTARKTSTKETS